MSVMCRLSNAKDGYSTHDAQTKPGQNLVLWYDVLLKRLAFGARGRQAPQFANIDRVEDQWCKSKAYNLAPAQLRTYVRHQEMDERYQYYIYSFIYVTFNTKRTTSCVPDAS